MSNQPFTTPLKIKIWAFYYCPCIHESAYATMSLHLSKEGAEKAMAWHKEERGKEWQRLVDGDEDKGTEMGYDKLVPFGNFERWIVDEVEVLP